VNAWQDLILSTYAQMKSQAHNITGNYTNAQGQTSAAMLRDTDPSIDQSEEKKNNQVYNNFKAESSET